MGFLVNFIRKYFSPTPPAFEKEKIYLRKNDSRVVLLERSDGFDLFFDLSEAGGELHYIMFLSRTFSPGQQFVQADFYTTDFYLTILKR